MKKTGRTDLPLHRGTVPNWLRERMEQLGSAIIEAILLEYGRDEVLRRLADPDWFQALGAVMGMDWHSSGITTSVLYALSRSLNGRSRELGLYFCGGRGNASRRTPDELQRVGEATGLDSVPLIRASRLSAKVDNTCVQDGFQLYLHSFIVSSDGKWAVIQQGMNPEQKLARRYHWLSEGLSSFVDAPQSGIVGRNKGEIRNLSDNRAGAARDAIQDFVTRPSTAQERELALLEGKRRSLPSRHEVRPEDVNSKRLGAVLALAHETGPGDFTETLLLRGLGPRTLQSLALVAETIYGTPTRFSDPARFSFAHGGKDGHPAPVPLKIYDRSINVLRRAVECAKIGQKDRLEGLRKLDLMRAEIEQTSSPHADVEQVIRRERQLAPRYGGRTVFD